MSPTPASPIPLDLLPTTATVCQPSASVVAYGACQPADDGDATARALSVEAAITYHSGGSAVVELGLEDGFIFRDNPQRTYQRDTVTFTVDAAFLPLLSRVLSEAVTAAYARGLPTLVTADEETVTLVPAA